MQNSSIKLVRTFREGWNNFRRNGWLTVATITVLTLSLLIVGLTFVFGLATSTLLDSLEQKLSVNVAFNTDTPEADILQIKSTLEQYGEVASVEYISRDQALRQFLDTNKDDPSITKALEEIGDNPLPASLTIHARHPEQYDTIARALDTAAFKDQINRIDYGKNKKIIDAVSSSSRNTKRTGLVLAVIFVAVSVVVAFNTIRINMYSRRQEFEVMRLVGASNIYMRMPSVFEGMFYGTVAALITLALMLPAIHFIGAASVFSITPGFLTNYFIGHFPVIFAAVLVMGWALGAMSGFLALGKYSKV